MPQSLRLLCVCLGVTIMVALQAHGVINTQHRIEHGLQFPGVSYAEAASIDHDHDHDHEHDQTDPSPTTDAPAFDVADTPGGDAPINHHHHSGGDVHVALATPVHPTETVISTSAHLGPTPGLTPPGVRGDGPSHPPKQQRLIV
ncbi:hypothetical protein GCM10009422_21820 [Brevundimonas kwangchunensis]|uniref:Secreted protein n=1 Tax=Brevundimonas kwangchunensis TaxID=322163 RepID=A0ABN1GZX9_9CAUL